MEKNHGTTGLGLSSVLTIIFVVLKLVGVINWSWWWVFSPILIDIGLALIIIIGWAIWFACREERYGGRSKKSKTKKH